MYSVGDRILEINGCSVIGKSVSQAQRMLSQVKWGEEVCILAMPRQEIMVLRFSEVSNAGVVLLKVELMEHFYAPYHACT